MHIRPLVNHVKQLITTFRFRPELVAFMFEAEDELYSMYLMLLNKVFSIIQNDMQITISLLEKNYIVYLRSSL